MAKIGNIYLIGPMGSGKTAVGRELARRLNRRFVDTDSWIEKKTGATVADVFAKRGEAVFRKLERQAVVRVSRTGGQVVALGGGAPCQPELRRVVSRTGLTVRLTCSQSALWKRLADGRSPCGRALKGSPGPSGLGAARVFSRGLAKGCGGRPLLAAPTAAQAKARFAALLRGREAEYPKGDLRVSTTRLDARRAAARIARLLARRGAA